ncbi:hypothetical protein [Paenibacillus sp. RC84]|uniref:DUF6973 domain-containing protein n=1 Tax=Paenibacillus sp. RC84 TaxID=3156252 RepID=UPI003518211D
MFSLSKTALSLLLTTVVVGATPVVSASALSESKSFVTSEENQQGLSIPSTIEELLKDPRYKDLTFTDGSVSLYKRLESLKNEYLNITAEQVTDIYMKERGIGYEEAKSIWMELTPAEKALAISNPIIAAIIDSCKEKAYSYTKTNYGKSGQGDTSDAFRHAVWNALMCKYAGKQWAWSYGTAHEQKDDAYYNKVFEDGYTGRQHTTMDLHNNEKGRDTWSILTDSIAWTSDGDLQNRVIAKINAGEMYILHN